MTKIYTRDSVRALTDTQLLNLASILKQEFEALRREDHDQPIPLEQYEQRVNAILNVSNLVEQEAIYRGIELEKL